jgi:ABC-2 type transport system ATP-binding protein
VLKHLISDYARETHATVIILSHNLQHTVDISTRIALLEHGQIIRDLSNVEGSATAELQEYFGAE